MLELEKYIGSFKESISKRFEKQEKEFKSLADKMTSFEEAQIENKKRLSRLEDGRNKDGKEDIELNYVKSCFFLMFFHFHYLTVSILKPFYILGKI
jgi:hypothetical protein